MPQKKNPDLTELARGKSARLLGASTALSTLIKGLPLAYNKDLQEGQEQIFDIADTLAGLLSVLPNFTRALKFRTHAPATRRRARLSQRHGRRHLPQQQRRPLPQSPRDHRQRRPPGPRNQPRTQQSNPRRTPTTLTRVRRRLLRRHHPPRHARLPQRPRRHRPRTRSDKPSQKPAPASNASPKHPNQRRPPPVFETLPELVEQSGTPSAPPKHRVPHLRRQAKVGSADDPPRPQGPPPGRAKHLRPRQLALLRRHTAPPQLRRDLRKHPRLHRRRAPPTQTTPTPPPSSWAAARSTSTAPTSRRSAPSSSSPNPAAPAPAAHSCAHSSPNPTTTASSPPACSPASPSSSSTTASRSPNATPCPTRSTRTARPARASTPATRSR